MNMKISTKLLAGFVPVVLLMTGLALYSVHISEKSLEKSVGTSSVFLAEEMLKTIDRDIYRKIEALRIHTSHFLFQKVLMASNREFGALKNVQEWIDEKEKVWVSTSKNDTTPFMETLIHNPLSDSLRKVIIQYYERRYGYPVVGEIFVTNRFGAVIAETGRTSDYRQDDESWWRVAREKGFSVGDVEYDVSAGAFAIAIGIRIEDEAGHFAGVMKAVVDTKGLVREAEVVAKKFETTRVQLITGDGRLIYSTRAFRFMEDLSGTRFFKKIGGENGSFTWDFGGKEILYSYARSKGYRGFKGLGWILLVGRDVQEVLAPAFSMRNRILVVSLILIAVAILIALFMSRSITRPIAELIKGAGEIGQGRLDYRIPVAGRDEMGRLATSFNEMAAQRKREEGEILASRARLEYLLTSSPAVIYTSRASGDYGATFISDNIRVQMDYEPGQFLEDPGFWADHVHPDDKSRIFDQLPHLFEKGRHIHEYRFLTGKGHYRWMHDELMLVRDASGNPSEIVGCWLDIHGRKQVEETLKESEERFRSFFHMAAIGMVMGDTDGCFVQVNGAFCEIVGYDEKALIGRPFQSLVHPLDLAEELPLLTRLLKGEISHYHREERLIHREGREVWTHVSVSLIRDKDGRPVNLIAGVENITELRQHRVHLEQMVEDRTAKLARSNQELEQFAYVASHDLQEPLRKVQAFGDRFVARYGDQVDEKGRDYLARMQGASQRMGTMIQDLLSLSRVTTQGESFAPVNLWEEVQKVLSDLEVAIDESGGLFEIGELPVIEADPSQIRQLMQNLLSNAFKYRKEGEPPLVKIYAVMSESDGPEGRKLCRIHVEDNGIGFEQKYIDRIFQPFQRLHGRSEYEGTGIGLAVCRKIVERHGGNITAKSEPGHGSTFIVTLPANQQKETSKHG